MGPGVGRLIYGVLSWEFMRAGLKRETEACGHVFGVCKGWWEGELKHRLLAR